MQKEKLTLQHIKQDVCSSRKEHISYVTLYGALLSLVVGLLIASFCLAPALFLYYLFMYILALGMLIYKIVVHACHLIALYRCENNSDCLVTDKLVNAESIDRYKANSHAGKFRLSFARFGPYIIPEKNYAWSKTFSMSNTGVFNYAIPGDEFYLLLSKPHSGKILFAYNTKMFELET